jgi:UDP-N-acetylglucosamine 2-epimerase
MKFYLNRFNRAESAIDGLKTKMQAEDMITENIDNAGYIIISGDRIEMFDFALKMFRKNKEIIHLWAGELSRCNDEDEVYRSTITLMSSLQLCNTPEAKKRVEKLCKAVDKKPNAYVVGSLWYDNLSIETAFYPNEPYALILYNPPTRRSKEFIQGEILSIKKIIEEKMSSGEIKGYWWIEPNGDKNSELLKEHTNTPNLKRERFLGFLKNCRYFISNSSCVYSEAPFLLDKQKIIHIGKRNENRESKTSKMDIPHASDNIIKILKSLQ